MVPLSLEQADQAHRNLVEATWEFIRRFPRAHREAWPEATAFRSGVPVPDANQLILSAPPGDVKALVGRARRFFPSGYPFEILSPAPGERDPFAGFPSAGSGPALRLPGMWMDLPLSFPSPPAGLSVRTVADRDGLSDFRRVMGSVYHIPAGFLRIVFPGSALRGDGSAARVRLILGYAGPRPVAGSVLVATDGIAGVYWVATDLRQRRRGYGEAVTWAALAAGEELGARVGFLQASPLGRPVYERMGFRTVLEYQPWQPLRPRLDRMRTGLRLLGSVLASSLRRAPVPSSTGP